MAKEQIENIIRDKLADNLDILKDDLELIEKEKFLPNNLGTRGFVDILAKDSNNRYVLIELKRSKASSREALHEVLKYVEGIKENKGLRNDEIHVLIVSTEWKELLVPFSSFLSIAPVKVTGYKLNIDEDYTPLSTTVVEALVLNNDRLLSDMHSVHLYKNSDNLQKGLESHNQVLKEKGIEDYVLVILRAHEDLYTFTQESFMAGLHETRDHLGIDIDKQYVMDLANKLPKYDYIIYRAVQVLDETHYYNIIKNDEDLLEVFEEFIDSYEDEEKFYLFHEYAIDSARPLPYSDSVEIGNPAKFSKRLLEDEKWEILKINRSGKFLNNELLTDEIIINEISGSTGTNKQKYMKEFRPSETYIWDMISNDIEKCLVDNEIWKVGILHAIQKLKKSDFKDFSEGVITIYNPLNTILSIYKYMTAENIIEGFRWIPNYILTIKEGSKEKIFMGCLYPNTSKITFNDLMKEYYEDNSFGLLMCMTWGGYEYRDVDIASTFGLEYTNFYIEVDDNSSQTYKFNGFKYIKIEDIDPFMVFTDFIKENKTFVNDIYSFYEDHTLTNGIFVQ